MINKLKKVESQLRELTTTMKGTLSSGLIAAREKTIVYGKMEESLFWVQKAIEIIEEDEKRLLGELKELEESLFSNLREELNSAYAHPKTTTTSTNSEELIAAKALDSWNTRLCNYDSSGKATFNEMIAQCMKFKIPNLRYKDSYYTYTFIPKTGNHQWLMQDKNSEVAKNFSDQNGNPKIVL